MKEFAESSEFGLFNSSVAFHSVFSSCCFESNYYLLDIQNKTKLGTEEKVRLREFISDKGALG